MKKLNISALLIFAFLIGIHCQDDDKNIIGNKSIEQIETLMPSILADGIATTNIIATVYDSAGYAKNIQVNFTTTRGSITNSSFTDEYGMAAAVLTSEASQTDLVATVTAEIDAKSLNKKSPGGFEILLTSSVDSTVSLKKSYTSADASKNLSVTFLGVTVNIKLDKADLTADGTSTAKLSFDVFETTSEAPVSSAKLSMTAKFVSLPNEVLTDDKGQATAIVTSAIEAVTDTIKIEYGKILSFTKTITMRLPKLYLLPDSAKLKADGSSELLLFARAVTLQNHPLEGVTIFFSSTDGIITETALTDENGKATATLVSSTNENPNVIVVAQLGSVADTSKIQFVESLTPPVGKVLLIDVQEQVIRNGVERVPVTATLVDEYYQPLVNRQLFFSTVNGHIDSVARTNDEGQAIVNYSPDAGEDDATDFIAVRFDTLETTQSVSLLGVTLQITADPLSIPADGNTKSTVSALVKLSTSLVAVPDAQVKFSSDIGLITSVTNTDEYGVAYGYFSSRQIGTAHITVYYGKIVRNLAIDVTPEIPNSIVLSSEPQFIWVKETGNIEQTMITATVLSQIGEPLRSTVKVKFYIRNGPNGGEFLEPSVDGNPRESVEVETVGGKAQIKLRAGTRSGTVEVQADLVNHEISARTTNIVIRSGPPYIYLDYDNPYNYNSHMSMAFQYLNLPGWMFLDVDSITVSVGDKYNNPVDLSTTVYLTTSGGVVTTDIKIDTSSLGFAELYTGHPLPYIESDDPNALEPHHIKNPNFTALEIPVTVPDFDGDGVENNGIAYIMAKTHGQDQNGNDAIVWRLGRVIFSGPLDMFSVTSDRNTLRIGQVANITIRIWDINGNPVAAGSQLYASTTDGKLSATELMPEKENYGFGSTYYTVQLTNDLDPEDSNKTAIVNLSLESPNGSTNQSVFIQLEAGF